MQVKIKYGSGNELTKDFPNGTSIGCVLGNPHVKGALGYGQSVEGSVMGVPQSNDTLVAEGMVISVNDKACAKA